MDLDLINRVIISIHTLRVEGDAALISASSLAIVISIHTLRVEGDWKDETPIEILNISIHTLRVEGDVRCVQPKKLRK